MAQAILIFIARITLVVGSGTYTINMDSIYNTRIYKMIFGFKGIGKRTTPLMILKSVCKLLHASARHPKVWLFTCEVFAKHIYGFQHPTGIPWVIVVQLTSKG